jgi:hypothetical protein
MAYNQLRGVAQLCPDIYGTAVLEARSFLRIWKNEYYRNECEPYFLRPDKNQNPFQYAVNQFKVTNDTLTETKTKHWLYPNPSRGRFTLHTETAEVSLPLRMTVYNSQGIKIMERTLFTREFELNVPNGLYTIELRNNTVHISEKIVIIHD